MDISVAAPPRGHLSDVAKSLQPTIDLEASDLSENLDRGMLPSEVERSSVMTLGGSSPPLETSVASSTTGSEVGNDTTRDDVERFDGKIVYNPDGSAYIIEENGESSDSDAVESLPLPPLDGAIVDDGDSRVSCSLPQIGSAVFFCGQSSALSRIRNSSDVHSFRVYSVRGSKNSGARDDCERTTTVKFPMVDYSSVPIKPILMCFVCKLSFGFAKSFVAHAMADHSVELNSEEKEILEQKNTSAILQVVGVNKEAVVAFLEPLRSAFPEDDSHSASQTTQTRNSNRQINESNSPNNSSRGSATAGLGTTAGLVCPDHPAGKPAGLECARCDLAASSSRGPMALMATRNSCKTLKCPKCNWHYKYQETLEIHMKEKHPENEASCVYCLTNQAHPRLSRGESYTCGYKPYRCDLCNYSTTTKGNLSIHMQSDKHLNNAQELAGSANAESKNHTTTVSTPVSTSSAAPSPASLAKTKPTWRCDVCNYETTIARNLRIHMTSEKHVQNVAALQQNLVQPAPPPPIPAAATDFRAQENTLAEIAYKQAMFLQMLAMGQGQAQSMHSSTEDMGLNPETMEPPPEPLESNPAHVFHCLVCGVFHADSAERVAHHVSLDRSRQREHEVVQLIGGHFVCRLCAYKTTLKANFQLHCKTDKHLQRLQHALHIQEGGPANEWKLKLVNGASNMVQIRCNVCEYYTNSAHKLKVHAASARHESAVALFRYLSSASKSSDSSAITARCLVCKFECADKVTMLQHARSLQHIHAEQMAELQRRNAFPTEGKEGHASRLSDIFSVTCNETTIDKSGDYTVNKDYCDAYHGEAPDHPNSEGRQKVEKCSPSQPANNHMASKGTICCPLCQSKFSCLADSESHAVSVHNVNSEGLRKLLILIKETPSEDLDDNNSEILQIKRMKTEYSDSSTNSESKQASDVLHNSNSTYLRWNNNKGQTLTVSERHSYKYRCSQCSLAFQTLEKLEQHSQYHVIRDASKCPLCGRSFRSLASLQKHVESSHAEMNEEEAVIMRESLLSYPLLLNGLAAGRSGQLTASESLKCHYSDSDDSKQVTDDDEEDASNHSNDPRQRIACNNSSKAETRQYLEDKYMDPNRPFKCDICKESFTQKNILLSHYNTVSHLHRLKRRQQQELPSLSTSESLANALAASPTANDVARDDSKPWRCVTCSVAYSQRSALDVHLRSVLHQTRISKVHPLTAADHIDLTGPPMGQPEQTKQGTAQDGNQKNGPCDLGGSRPFDERPGVEEPGKDLSSTPELDHLSQALSQLYGNNVFPCSRCAFLCLSQEQLTHHQQFYCQMQSSAGVSSVTQETELEGPSAFELALNKAGPQRSSRMLRHLLASYGFEQVMQFNEWHQKQRGKADDHNVSVENKAEEKENLEIPQSSDSEKHPEIQRCVCPLCKKSFSSIWVLKVHTEEIHKQTIPHDFIEKYAEDIKNNLNSQMASHSSSQPPPPLTPAGQVYSEKEGEALEAGDSVKQLVNSTGPVTSRTPSRAASSTPASGIESFSTGLTNSALAQQMSDMQTAINAMGLASQFQFNPALGLAGLGMTMPMLPAAALAVMNQAAFMPLMMGASLDPLQAILAAQSQAMLDPSFVAAQQRHVQQPQEQAAAVSSQQQQKRGRTRITEDQLKVLRAHFDINNSPTDEQIQKMASQSGLPTKVIKHWFRNTLFKERQKNKDSPYNFSNPPSTSLNVEEYGKTGEAKVVLLKEEEQREILAAGNRTQVKTAAQEASEHDTRNKPNIESKPSGGKSNIPGLVEFPDVGSSSASRSMALEIQQASRTTVTVPAQSPGRLESNILGNMLLPLSPLTPQGFSPGSSGSSVTGSSTGKRANRTRFSDNQIKVLQEFFENNAYPKDDDLEYLSRLLGLSPRVIVVWFQNARQKARKVYENQPPVDTSDDGSERFQRTPSLNYECKKCTLVFQRYYELIRHQKAQCYKEEDAKRSAVAQAAAAQAAANLSSSEENSSSSPTGEQQDFATTQPVHRADSPVPGGSHSQPSSKMSDKIRQDAPMKRETAKSNKLENRQNESAVYQCEVCNLSFAQVDLWREHQLLHMVNPEVGLLMQQQAQLAASLNFMAQHFSGAPIENLSRGAKRSFEEAAEDEDNEGEQPRDKRLRTTILPEQLEYLYLQYQIESNPSRKMLETISKEVGLKKRVVQVWFQNTRARERKGQFRVSSQVIHKRCPLCSAPFRIRSALESHLSSRHPECEVNIDSLPDEDPASMATPTSGNPLTKYSSPASVNEALITQLSLSYQQSLAQLSAAHSFGHTAATQNPFDDCAVAGPSTAGETPLDLSRPMKPGAGSLHEADDGSRSDLNDYMDCDESNPSSPTPGKSINSNASSIGTGAANKRYRTQMTVVQVQAMKILFSEHKTPTMAECEALGREIGLPKRVVQVWFQNARAKDKKGKMNSQTSASHLNDSASGQRDECRLCGIKYSQKYSLQDHVFSQQHIQNVKNSLTQQADVINQTSERKTKKNSIQRDRSREVSPARTPVPPPAAQSSESSEPMESLLMRQLYGMGYAGLMAHGWGHQATSDNYIMAALQQSPAALTQIAVTFAEPGSSQARFTLDGSSWNDLEQLLTSDDLDLTEQVTSDLGILCKSCQMLYPSETALIQHGLVCPANSAGPRGSTRLTLIQYSCKECRQQTFSSALELKRHFTEVQHDDGSGGSNRNRENRSAAGNDGEFENVVKQLAALAQASSAAPSIGVKSE